MNPRLRQTCRLCADWGQREPHCAHGLDDGNNPGALWFTPASVLTIELGVRASIALTDENRIGNGAETIALRTRRAA